MTEPRNRTRPEGQQKVIEAAIDAFVSRHPELRQATVVTEIPPPLRWAGVIVGAIMTAVATAGLFWLASTVNEMQVTLGRMDERIGAWISSQDQRYADLEARIEKLENKVEKK